MHCFTLRTLIVVLTFQVGAMPSVDMRPLSTLLIGKTSLGCDSYINLSLSNLFTSVYFHFDVVGSFEFGHIMFYKAKWNLWLRQKPSKPRISHLSKVGPDKVGPGEKRGLSPFYTRFLLTKKIARYSAPSKWHKLLIYAFSGCDVRRVMIWRVNQHFRNKMPIWSRM